MRLPSTKSTEQLIRTQPRTFCALCGSSGEPLHVDQPDRLFGTEGLWNLTKCSNYQCGLIWLNPMPLVEDIGKAYANYYTHCERDVTGHVGLLKRAYHSIKRGYLAGKYGYQVSPHSALIESFGKLLYLFPLRRNDADLDVRHLRAQPQGRLLDVGCGSGEWLLTMQELGWQVEGLDFDENAVKVATLRGLRIRCGTLEEQNYPDECFDAITLNHVIEHLPNPVMTLAECRRILKKSGILVLYTPNSASLGHLIFNQDWRGLEPPRHLHVFCPSSMRVLLRLSGFNESCIRTVNSGYILEHSLKLWTGDIDPNFGIRLATKVVTHVITLLEQGLLVGKPDVGECLAVQTFKK